MNNRKRIFLTIGIIGLLISQQALAQQITQTFRGRILDSYTEQPLPGATVVIQGTDPLIGTMTGPEGRFQ
ncbi:MAG TPA: hypothetical protein VJ877_00355, partial [Bacteroidales bacterium]|nr:hypothetical protein [Bacteroidales bacterium]